MGLDSYDTSVKEQQLIAKRKDLRMQYRAEWIKKFENPHTRGEGGYIFDPALQRWMSARAQHWHYFKPNLKTAKYPAILLASIVGYYYLIKWEKDPREAAIRRGEVSYRDRRFKFV